MTPQDSMGKPLAVNDWVTVIRTCRGIPHCEQDLGLTFRIGFIVRGDFVCVTGRMRLSGFFVGHPKFARSDDVQLPCTWLKKLDADPDALQRETEDERELDLVK